MAHEKNYQLQHTNNYLETTIKLFTEKTNHSYACLFTCDNDLMEKESNALHDLEKKSIQIKTTKNFQHMTLKQHPIFQITLCLCVLIVTSANVPPVSLQEDQHMPCNPQSTTLKPVVQAKHFLY